MSRISIVSSFKCYVIQMLRISITPSFKCNVFQMLRFETRYILYPLKIKFVTFEIC